MRALALQEVEDGDVTVQSLAESATELVTCLTSEPLMEFAGACLPADATQSLIRLLELVGGLVKDQGVGDELADAFQTAVAMLRESSGGGGSSSTAVTSQSPEALFTASVNAACDVMETGTVPTPEQLQLTGIPESCDAAKVLGDFCTPPERRGGNVECLSWWASPGAASLPAALRRGHAGSRSRRISWPPRRWTTSAASPPRWNPAWTTPP